MKNALKEISTNVKIIVQQNKKKTAVFMFPVSFFMLLLLLRELPHKCPVDSTIQCESLGIRDFNEKIIIFLHGFGANHNRSISVTS